MPADTRSGSGPLFDITISCVRASDVSTMGSGDTDICARADAEAANTIAVRKAPPALRIRMIVSTVFDAYDYL
ncbi:MAG TPA: hypothetical protein VHI13_17960 [Candidatus Kapabacteria bacterium]|nr:hypothetical protein [Candidatus Kapabacteria bacterium]